MTHDTNPLMQKRLDLVIARACDQSSHTKVIHVDYHLPGNFRYVASEGMDCPASAIYTMHGLLNKCAFVEVDMNYPDYTVASFLHHELTHIQQCAGLEKHGVDYMAISTDDALALDMMFEIQAYHMQYEGPFLGVLNAVEQNDTILLSTLKESFEDEIIRNGMIYQANMLLHTAMPDVSAQDYLNRIGYAYFNDYKRSEPQEKAARLRDSRMGTAKSFLQMDRGVNNCVLDNYIQHALTKHIDTMTGLEQHPAKNDPLARFQVNASGGDKTFLGMNVPTRERLVLVTSNKDGVFLTQDDWAAATGTQNNRELVERAIAHSKHKPLYEKALTV